MKRLLLLFTTILLILNALCQVGTSFSYNGIMYQISSTSPATVRTTANTLRFPSEVVIPSSVIYQNIEYTVTAIGTFTFYQTRDVLSVTIPQTITKIEDEAFRMTYDLKTINIPSSLISIDSAAFYHCSGITSLTIPPSVISIHQDAFIGTSTYITVDANNQKYSSVDGVLFNKTKTFLIHGTYNQSNIYSIPNSVTEIGNRAFFSIYGLDSIIIPSSVKIIGDEAFAFSSLKSVVIPSSVTSIAKLTFSDCQSLVSVTIPTSVTTIGNGAFSGCYNLTSLSIPSSVTSIGDYLFEGCSKLKSIIIPPSITDLGSYTFKYCTVLSNVVLPPTITSLRSAVFYGCKSLSSITIPSSVKTIEDEAFYQCASLKSIVIPPSVTTINGAVFFCCINLNSVVIPSSVTSINNAAFKVCKSLKAITIPSSVTFIGAGAFQGTGLKSVIIPTSLTSIENNTFSECDSLNTVIIPPSITTIGYSAFYYCKALKMLIIPPSMKSIGWYTFGNCNLLTTIVCNNTNPEIAQEVTFDYFTKSNCTIYVPAGYKEIYSTNKNWQGFKAIKEINELTSLDPKYIDVSLPNLISKLPCIPISGATNYEWTMLNNTTQELIKDTSGSLNYIIPAKLGFEFNDTYTVFIRAKVGGVWGDYGLGYNITTPPAPTSKLGSSYCNITLTSFTNIIKCTTTTGATGYEFNFSDNATGTTYIKTVTSTNSLSVSAVPGLVYNKTYSVKVRPVFYKSYGDFGTVCTITTPASIPTTNIQDIYCGTTLKALNSTVYCNAVIKATNYEWEVTDLSTQTVKTYLRGSNTNSFQLTMIGGIQYGKSYSVRVRAISGTEKGVYGKACTLTTPSTIPVTQLKSSYCGTTLTSLKQVMYCNTVSGATNYEWEVTDIATSEVKTRLRGSNATSFVMTMISGVKYETTYSIKVRAISGTLVGEYGTVCEITTPASPVKSALETTEAETTNEVLADVEVATNGFSIYPIPAKTTVTVEAPVVKDGYQVSILNTEGQILLETMLESGSAENIDISSLTSGSYIVRLEANGEEVKYLKFVKE